MTNHSTIRVRKLELELIQSHMAQKPVLRGEVGCSCVAREVSVECATDLPTPQVLRALWGAWRGEPKSPRSPPGVAARPAAINCDLENISNSVCWKVWSAVCCSVFLVSKNRNFI